MEEFNNRQRDNFQPEEIRQPPVPKDAEELKQPTMKDPEEFGNVARASAKSKKKSSKNGVLSFITAMAAAGVVTVTAVSGTASIGASIEALAPYDTYISYYAVVEETDAPLSVVLYNDFTERQEPIEAGGYEGVFENLQPDMSYRLKIVAGTSLGDQTLYQTTVRTQPPIPLPVTQWNGVTHECTCDVDGYFHFTMDFVDENYYWWGFQATLYDEYGNYATVEIEDPHAPQRIDVVGNELMGNVADFYIWCQSLGPDANEDGVVELYYAQVKI